MDKVHNIMQHHYIFTTSHLLTDSQPSVTHNGYSGQLGGLSREAIMETIVGSGINLQYPTAATLISHIQKALE